MLRKLTSTDEPARLVLLCDESVWEAQLVEARRLVDEDLTPAGEGDFIDTLITAMRASMGPGSDLASSLSAVRLAGGELLAKVMGGEEREKAEERLNKALTEEDVRLCLAYVRAQSAAAAYRESSDTSDLLVPSPEGATVITIKAPTKEQLRKFERGFRPKPRLGEMHYSRAGDAARKAGRRGEDVSRAFAEFVAGLDESAQQSIDDYEAWVFDRDCDLFALAVQDVEGFPLIREPGQRYPVADFLNACIEAEGVIAETARHIRNICNLGKSGRSSERFSPGNRDRDQRPGTQSPMDGLVVSVPETGPGPKTPD